MLYSLPLIVLFSFMFSRINHPLSTGLILLVQTILVSISASLFKSSYWFSYILFLIFLGGILVLFIYVTSLAANEQFKINREFLIIFLLFLILSARLIFLDPIILANKFETALSTVIKSELEYSTASLIVRIVYNKPRALFTLFIIRYLLLTLFVIVKLIRSSSSPLRSTTYDNPCSESTSLI